MTSPGSNIMDDIYVGPYTGTVGTQSNQQIICDDFADESEVGNGWATTANSFSSIGNTLWGQYYIQQYGATTGLQMATTLYEEAAWLTLQMLSGNYSSTQIGYISYAIWYLFDANGTKNNPTGVLQWIGGTGSSIYSGLIYWVNLAASSYSSLTPQQLAKFTIYTPNGCTGGPGSCAGQEFMMVQTPEGGAALAYLLLAGVACFGAMFRSRSQTVKRIVA